jgi:hypothetical protein
MRLNLQTMSTIALLLAFAPSSLAHRVKTDYDQSMALAPKDAFEANR